MQNQKTINCPNCKTVIDIDEILIAQLRDEISKDFNARLAAQKKEYNSKVDELNSERVKIEEVKNNLKAEKLKLKEEINEGVQTRLKSEKVEIEKKLRTQLADESEEQMRALKDELNNKSEKLRELNKTKAEVERLKREKDEMRDEIEAKAQKDLNEQIRLEKEKIRRAEQEKIELVMAEQNHKMQQLQDQLKEAQRKAEQGSMQIQGEVQELAIEEFLKENFPLDTIDEIKKGARGADCLQVVNTRQHQNIGKIYYESKRTKDFQKSWIEKFRADMREKNADIGVLVTEAMPSDMDRMGQRDGIWICSFTEFKGLCFVLRETIIQIGNAVASQENKGDKMSLLYSFLTGNEFRLQIEAIVEGFTQMQEDLEAEKRALNSQWKKREKQIQKVLINTNNMYSSIKGIAGNAIQPVQMFELPGSDEPEVDETGQAKLGI